VLPESRFQFVTRQKSNRKATIYKKNSQHFQHHKSQFQITGSLFSLSLSKSRVSSGSDQRAQVLSGEFLTLTPASERAFFCLLFISCPAYLKYQKNMAPKKSKVKKRVTQPAKSIIERTICSHPMLKRVQKEVRELKKKSVKKYKK
jgi:hypothetical protein